MLADDFLTSSMLTIVLPIAVLIVVLAWWVFLFRRDTK
jgi:nitrogen fixation-related uncharacterized protein